MKYINEDLIEMLRETYEETIINDVMENKNNIENVINIFLKYKITCIEEIMNFNLTLFFLSPNVVERKLVFLIKKLGPDYIELINEDLDLVCEL